MEKIELTIEERKLKRKESARLHYIKNKASINEKSRIYYEANSDTIKEKCKKYSEDNKDSCRMYKRTHYKKNKVACDIRSSLYRIKNKIPRGVKARIYEKKNRERILLTRKLHRDNHPEKGRARNARVRATKLQATPKWLTKEQNDQIIAIYKLAKELEKLDGIKRHVDHIIPLLGKNVCGLHVPWNLQILTATENMSKGNRLI